MAKNIFMIARPATGAPAVFNQTTDPFFKGWNAFELMSFNLGSTNPTTIGGTGVGAGKISFSPFTFTKQADMNSAVFLRYCATGAHFDRITIYVTAPSSAGGQETTTQIYTLGLVFVTSIVNEITSGDDVITESITMAYGQLQQRVITFSPTGLRTGFVENTWDLTANNLWVPPALDGPG